MREATIQCHVVQARGHLARGGFAAALQEARRALAIDAECREATEVITEAERRAEDVQQHAAREREATARLRVAAEAVTRLGGLDEQDATVAARFQPAAGTGKVRVVADWMTSVVDRVRSTRGQVTTEWLMIAGLLTSVGLLFVQLVPPVLRTFVRGLAWGIRTIAP